MIKVHSPKRLAEIRKRLKLTQTELAKKIGVDKSIISRIENGKFLNTEIGTLQAYIEALGGKLEIYVRIGQNTHPLID
jgi:transcriptional regulator with XRE-family HTH domain